MADGIRTGISAWRNETTESWWRFAETEEEMERAPTFLRPLLEGRSRWIEVSCEQIREAFAWAASVPGWEPAGELKPLHKYDPAGVCSDSE